MGTIYSERKNIMSYSERPRWTASQVNFIQENYHKMSDEQIANIIGRTKKSVRRKRERMLLKKEMGRVNYPPVVPG